MDEIKSIVQKYKIMIQSSSKIKCTYYLIEGEDRDIPWLDSRNRDVWGKIVISLMIQDCGRKRKIDTTGITPHDAIIIIILLDLYKTFVFLP